jgi:hypothetical protein
MIKIFIIAFFLALSGIVLSQKPFKGGILAGIAGSQIDGDGQNGYKKGGLTIGLFTGREIKSGLNWYMEFRYTGKGASDRFSFLDSVPSQSYEVQLHYLELPVYLAYKAGTNLFIEGGVSVGYLLSSKIYDPNSNTFSDPERKFKSYDIDGLIGARFLWSEQWAMNLRLCYSLLPFYKPDGSISNRQSFHNNTLELNFFYYLQQ